MKFDIGSFGSKFKNTIDWALKGKCSQKIKDDLETYQRLKGEFSTVPDVTGALKLLVETKATNSFYRSLPGPRKVNFEADFDSFVKRHKQNLRTSQAMNELTDLLVKYSIFKIAKQKAKEWLEKLLGGYPTLKDFTEELYRLRKKGKNGLLRDKGADHYLRDVGYWDIIPIDVHEKRFLVRTGIYHTFSVIGRQDPLADSSLQDALNRFCSVYLKGKTVEGVDLGSAPGIVDLFIWSYCSDDRYKICGSTPRCDECVLEDACLFGIANIQRAIAQGRIKVSEKLGPDEGIIIDAWIVDPNQDVTKGHLRLEISTTVTELRKVVSAYPSHYGALLNPNSYSNLPKKKSAFVPITLVFEQGDIYQAQFKVPPSRVGDLNSGKPLKTDRYGYNPQIPNPWIPSGPVTDKYGNDVKLTGALVKAGFPVISWTKQATSINLPKPQARVLQRVNFLVEGGRWTLL
jgi:hypothetical protein